MLRYGGGRRACFTHHRRLLPTPIGGCGRLSVRQRREGHGALELSELCRRPVQIIILNAAPADLVHRVLRDGVLVLEPNKSRRIAFEVRARNQYFDLLPILRQYRQGPRP